MAKNKKLLKWRKAQKRGAIMKPETFSKIEQAAEDKYGKERAQKIAGAAYWKTAKAKFRGSARGSGQFTDEDLIRGYKLIK